MPLFGRKKDTTSAIDWLENVVSTAAYKEGWNQNKAYSAALREIAMYTAVGLIADLISGCEIQVYDDGEPKKNEMWYVLNVSANPNRPSQDVIARWVIDYYYHEQGGLIVPLGKQPNLHLFNAESFAVDERPVKGDEYREVFVGGLGLNRTFRANDVYILKQDGRVGIKKLIDRACDDYLEMLYYSKKMFISNSGEKYELQLGTYPSGDPDKQKQYMDNVKTGLDDFLAQDQSVHISTRDQELKRLSASNNTMSPSGYMSARQDIYDIVAEALHLPTGLFSGTNTSVDQLLNEALTMAIDPLAEKMSRELTRKTFTQDEIINRNRKVVVDTTSIKHIDAVDMADKIDKLISSGIMSIDEARSACNLSEIGEDWSKQHYLTKNYGDIDVAEGGE